MSYGLLPKSLQGVSSIVEDYLVIPTDEPSAAAAKKAFPNTYGQKALSVQPYSGHAPKSAGSYIKVGVILAGGQSPGSVELVTSLSTNVTRWNSSSQVLGFKNGFNGLVKKEFINIDQTLCESMLSESGLAVIGSGRISLTDTVQAKIVEACKELQLTALVILGGVNVLSDAAKLSETLVREKTGVQVLTCCKRSQGWTASATGEEEMSCGYGFDSTTKLYSWLVGNIAADVSSARTSYHFVRLMGRTSSYNVLETALDVHPNLAIIGEELWESQSTLSDLINMIADMVCVRAKNGKAYGVVIFPEFILSSIREMNELLHKIEDLISSKGKIPLEELIEALPKSLNQLVRSLPDWFLKQISTPSYSTADVQVEKLLSSLTVKELSRRKEAGIYLGKFAVQNHFYGYEARSQTSSPFDVKLGCSLGAALSAFLEDGHTGYNVSMKNLSAPFAQWKAVAQPLTGLMSLDARGNIAVRGCKLSLESYSFKAFKKMRDLWKHTDSYRFSMGTLSDALPVCVELDGLETQHRESTTVVREQEKLKELLVLSNKLAVEVVDFAKQRLEYQTQLPTVLKGAHVLEEITEEEISAVPSPAQVSELKDLFPATFPERKVFRLSLNNSHSTKSAVVGRPLRIGVVLSGGPAPGGHNIISGIHDFLKSSNGVSECIGFVNGPDGLLSGRHIVVNEDNLASFRNQGGFNLLGTSRTKIETEAQFAKARATVIALNLNGLVICGGDDSNTNAAILADYFKSSSTPCSVVGMPKTIDADLRSKALEMSFGFDTSTKVYSQIIANIMLDAQLQQSRWHFVRVMGRAASHIALECALQTHANYTVISEEVDQKKQTLKAIVTDVANLVEERSKIGKNYGVALIPEGLIEVTSDLKILVEELNENMAKNVTPENMEQALSPGSLPVFQMLPDWLKSQLMSERDPHGNVRVSLIESERLVATLVSQELANRGFESEKFSFWTHFLGYQGRCSLTSNFDSDYCYILGHTAGVLVSHNATGVIGAIRNLCKPVSEWELLGIPIVSLMRLERRHGKNKPVIEKKLVDLNGEVFGQFASKRESWRLADDFPKRSALDHLKGVLDHRPTLTLTIESGL